MQRTEISFKSGEILRKEMLKDMYEYPRIVMEGYYSSYSDGILYGLEWRENNEVKGHHIITPGALKLHGKIYYMSEPLCVEENFENLKIDSRYRLFFVEKAESYKEPSMEIFKLDFVAVLSADVEEAKKNGFYYSYIEVAAGNIFEKIKDAESLYGLYAAKDGYDFSLSPYLLRENILPLLEEKSEKHPLDFELLRIICLGESMPLSIVIVYIKEYYKTKSKAETDISELVNNSVKIFEEFIKAVKELHGEKTVIKTRDKTVKSEEASNMNVNKRGTL